MIRRVSGLALMALLLFVFSGSVSADGPPRAVVNRVGSEAQGCTFPWFDKNGELVILFFDKMEVYPNNPQDNLRLTCSTHIDYDEYASIQEACAWFPAVWGFDPCNQSHTGAMLLSGGNSGYTFSDIDAETGELLKCTYNWKATFTPSGNVEMSARFTPQSTIPAEQCE